MSHKIERRWRRHLEIFVFTFFRSFFLRKSSLHENVGLRGSPCDKVGGVGIKLLADLSRSRVDL